MAIITQQKDLGSWIQQINELCDQSSAIFENINRSSPDGIHPPSIEQSRLAVDTLIKKILNDEFDQTSGTLPKLEEFKKKLIIALPRSDRFMRGTRLEAFNKLKLIGSQYISACQCCKPMSYRKRLDFNYTVLRNVNIFFKNKPLITICSIGSGCCYQELMIHTALATQERKVNWVLLEPDLNEESSPAYKATIEFKKIVEFLSDKVGIESKAMSSYQYVKEIYPDAQHPIPDLFIAVDVESKTHGTSLDFTHLKTTLQSIASSEHPRLFLGLDKNKGLLFDTWPQELIQNIVA